MKLCAPNSSVIQTKPITRIYQKFPSRKHIHSTLPTIPSAASHTPIHHKFVHFACNWFQLLLNFTAYFYFFCYLTVTRLRVFVLLASFYLANSLFCFFNCLFDCLIKVSPSFIFSPSFKHFILVYCSFTFIFVFNLA